MTGVATRGSWPHTGAILAGGSSSRMGKPKTRLQLPDGRAMIDAVASALTPICARIVVVGDADALPGVASVEDLRGGLGPLGGIEALLASGLDTQYVVCPCDVPRITSAVLAALTISSGADATVLRIDGEDDPRPLPARISATALGAVSTQLDGGRRAVHRLLEAIEIDTVAAPRAWADLLVNINTPEDLAALE